MKKTLKVLSDFLDHPEGLQMLLLGALYLLMSGVLVAFGGEKKCYLVGIVPGQHNESTFKHVRYL